MARTLRRAREAAKKGILESDFNRKSITFKVTDADRRSSDKLLDWMKNSIAAVGLDYAQAKTALRDSIGFDAERLVGTVQFAPMRSIEELIDHQLGLTPTVSIGKFELRDRRFGIEIPLPIPVPSEGEWIGRLHVHPKPCLLQLRGPDCTEIELSGDLFLSSLPGLPIEQCKFRVKADFLDMVQSVGGDSTFKLNFHTADKRTPMQLEKLVRVITWAGLGSVGVQVWIEDQKLTDGTADINPLPNREAFERLRILIEPLVDLSRHLRVAPPEISIENVIAAEDQLLALYGFLTSDDMNVSAQVTADAPPSKISEVLTYGFADVGNWRFAALTQWKCSAQSSNAGMWNFTLNKRRILGRYAFEPADCRGAAGFQADFERFSVMPGVLVMDDNAVARLNQSRE